MLPEPTTTAAQPPEQRVLSALYNVAGLAFMVLVLWQQLDPDAPREWWHNVRDRTARWRRDRRELAAQLEEIVRLPETDDDEGDEACGSS